jgi:hypothetical protein
MKRFPRLLSFLRNTLIILGTLVIAVCLAYLVDKSTDRPTRTSMPTVKIRGDNRSESREESERMREVSLYGYGQYHYRIGRLMDFGDKSMLSTLRSDFMSDFKRDFGKRICTDERPKPTSLLVVSEVLHDLNIRLRESNSDESVLAAIVEFLALRMLPERDEDGSYWKPIFKYWKDPQGLWRIGLVTDYDERRELDAQRAKYAPDEATFRKELQKIPKAYALYLESLTVGRGHAIRMMDELLRLPADERRPLEAIAKYRRARLTIHLEDWTSLSDEDAKQRLAGIRADLESVPGHARNGSLDPALISENTVYWLAYTRSMILPSERLLRLGEADFAGAAATYIRMPMRGSANAVNSCFRLAKKICADKIFGPSVHDPDLRRIITMYLVAGGSNNCDEQLTSEEAVRSCAAWLDALASAGVGHEFDPSRLAMIEYATRRWEDCLHTVSLLPADRPVRLLLASRCNLRLTGDLKISRRLLDFATHPEAMAGLRDTQRRAEPAAMEDELAVLIDLDEKSELTDRVSAELGMTALCEGDFLEAFRLFSEAGFAEEADYVAECLLTTQELELFVARGIKSSNLGGKLGGTHVRTLLASRLFRDGRMEEGLEYVSDDIASKARSFVLLSRLAERTDLDNRTRADAYWRAALVIREIGETILHAPHGLSWTSDGSYTKPDSNWYVGYGFLPYLRLNKEREHEQAHRHKLIGPRQDEIKRLSKWIDGHVVHPVRCERDARYATFDLAIKAARLLPENDPAGGIILQYAGNLLKYREPKAAKPAYFLLATRFKETTYGAEALKRHWFSQDRPEPSADIISK